MIRRFTSLAALLLAGNLLAYPQPVHRVITEKAFDHAVAHLDEHLGLTSGQQLMARLWMSNGADDEDDGLNSLDHFFDPTFSPHILAGLAVPPFCPITAGFPADLRATTVGDIAVPIARQQYEAALVGPNPGTRTAHLESLFELLGHEVHLLEDSAQPEHTRNDQHLFALGATAASIYEEWSAENLLGSPAVSFDGYDNVSLPGYGDYFHTDGGSGMADFSNRNFFTQDTNIQDEQLAGNCRYYTSPDLDLNGAAERIQSVNEEYRNALGFRLTEVVDEQIWTSFPMDNLIGQQEVDNFHDFRSIIDFETRVRLACADDPTVPRSRCGVYSLGEPSYLTRAALLIPRAVGYSAGFIEHFFRGRISAQWTPDAANPSQVLLKVTNDSSERISDDSTIEALFKAAPSYFGRTTEDDTAIILFKQPISDLVPGFAGLDPGQTVTIGPLSIADLQPGDNINDFERRVIVTGKLGDEDDAVIGLVQGGKVPPELRVEVSWVSNGLTEPPSVGLGTSPLPNGSLIGPIFWFTPTYCNTFDSVDWCFVTPPAAPGFSGTAVFTISKTRTGTNYFAYFCNRSTGSMDVTIKVYANGQLKKTTQQTIDMNFNGFCPSPVGIYP